MVVVVVVVVVEVVGLRINELLNRKILLLRSLTYALSLRLRVLFCFYLFFSFSFSFYILLRHVALLCIGRFTSCSYIRDCVYLSVSR